MLLFDEADALFGKRTRGQGQPRPLRQPRGRLPAAADGGVPRPRDPDHQRAQRARPGVHRRLRGRRHVPVPRRRAARARCGGGAFPRALPRRRARRARGSPRSTSPGGGIAAAALTAAYLAADDGGELTWTSWPARCAGSSPRPDAPPRAHPARRPEEAGAQTAADRARRPDRGVCRRPRAVGSRPDGIPRWCGGARPTPHARRARHRAPQRRRVTVPSGGWGSSSTGATGLRSTGCRSRDRRAARTGAGRCRATPASVGPVPRAGPGRPVTSRRPRARPRGRSSRGRSRARPARAG